MSVIRVPYQPKRYKGGLDSLVAHHLLDKYFLEGAHILDPMAGSMTVEKEAKKLGISCISNDIIFKEGWDARNDWPLEDYSFDGVILHPPYYRAKKYSDDPKDIGNIEDLDEFIYVLMKMMAESKRVTRPGGYIILIIGDHRKEGRMHLVHSDIYQYASKRQGHPNIGALHLPLENYDLWEISATGTPFVSTKHMMMLNWCLAFRRPEKKITEYA